MEVDGFWRKTRLFRSPRVSKQLNALPSREINKNIHLTLRFTDDFLKASAFLKEHNIDSVVMEATGVYWITLFDMLEATDIGVTLVNGRQVKYLPARKSDVADCQWLQQLHSYGLLRPCFVPDETIRNSAPTHGCEAITWRRRQCICNTCTKH